MRRLLLILAILTFSSLMYGQGGTATEIRSGSALPSTAKQNAIFIINDGSGSIYVCVHSPTCTSVGQWVSISVGQTPAATVDVTPKSLNFGSGQTSVPTAAQPIAITATGNTPVTITSVTFGGSQFSEVVPGACNGVLRAGATCVDNIQFTASGSGDQTDTLTVNSNVTTDPGNPSTVALLGTGTAVATFPITLACAGLGNGEVTDGTALDCTCQAGVPTPTSVCQQSYSASTITLTAAADPISVFNTFAGGGLTTSPASLTVSQSQTVTAQFDLAPVSFTLSLAGAGQGGGAVVSDASASLGVLNCTSVSGVVASSGTSGCSGQYLQGAVVTLTETANATSTFVSWAGAPGCTTASTCVVTLGANTTVTANFSANSSTVQLSLTQTSTNCSVSGSTIACNWANAQLVGDTNICAAAWPDATTTVSSLTDTGGNTYTQVPTISPKTTTNLTQVLYYAQNITAAAAGARTTTMTLSSSAASSLVGTSLTSAHNNGTSATYTTASVALTSNNLILATFWGQLNSGNGPGAISTVADTGCGLTWQLVQALNFNSTQGTGTTTRIETWRTLGNGSSCTVTATWAQPVAGRGASISKFSGVDTSGSNGSGAIGIIATNTGVSTAPSVTMGTFTSAANGTFGVVGSGAATSRTVGAGMTLLGNDTLVSDEYAAGNNSPVTQTLGASGAWGAVGIEIKTSGSTGLRDLRCAEYAGVLQSGSPIDQSAAAVGSSAAPSSGGITTTVANDLLTGWTVSTTGVNTVSSGYIQRIKDTFGNDEEDQQGVAVATYAFTPTLTSSGVWIASQVAWKPQSTSAPTVFSLSLIGGGNGSGSVTSNAGTPTISGTVTAGNCTGACSSQVSVNATVTLTAVPQTGSVLTGWSGVTGCSTSAICIVPNITSNQNVTATFSLSGQSQFYVNRSTGSDSNSGLCAVAATPAGCSGPWRTVAHAASSLTVGPTGTVVNVAHSSSSYAETVTLSKSGSNPTTARIVFRCDAAWTVGGSTGCNGIQWNTYNVNNVDIGALPKLGFEYSSAGGQVAINNVANFGNCTGTFKGACNVGNSNHFLGNYIHDLATGSCPSSGAILAGQHGRSQTDVRAIGNQLDNIGTGASCSVMQGIYFATPGGIIQNNIITRVAAGAIQDYDASCSSVVSNNDVVNNRFGIIIYGSNGCTAGLNSVTNNIISNNSGAGIYNGFSAPAGDCTAGRSTLFSNNILFGNGTDYQQAQTSCEIRQGTISENPTATFVSYTGQATGNFQLKVGSQAINGGTLQCVSGGVTPCAPTTDFLNVARPQRQTLDRGAYELP